MATNTLYIVFFSVWLLGFATGMFAARHAIRTQRTTFRYVLFTILVSLVVSGVGAFAGIVFVAIGLGALFDLPELVNNHPYLVEEISLAGMVIAEFAACAIVTAKMLPRGRARE